MLSRLATVTILLAIPILAHGQPELGIAIKGGPNAAIWSGNDRAHRYGFSEGAATSIQWSLGRLRLGAQAELLYTPRGTKLVRDGEDLGRTRLHYVDLMIATRPGIRVGRADFYLLLGGGWNILLSANLYGTASGMTSDITDVLSRHDIALLAGAGGAFHLPDYTWGPLRFDTVFLEVRHDRGLFDIDTTDSKVKNRITSLMLGVSFTLGSSTATSSRDPASMAASRIK